MKECNIKIKTSMLLLKVIVLETNKAWQLFRAESSQIIFFRQRHLHPHTGTLSHKTNLFLHRQGYSCLSPALPLPGMTQTFQNVTEYSALKQSINSSFGSFMHVKCQLSCIFTFFFQNAKDHEKTL